MIPPDELPDALAASRRRWNLAVNETDVDAYAGLVCHDVVWIPPGQPAVQGRAAFRDWLAPFFEAYDYEFSVGGVGVRSAGGWAVETGDFRSRMTPRSGGDTMEHAGRFLVIWRRDEDAVWRIERYADVPPDGGPGDG